MRQIKKHFQHSGGGGGGGGEEKQASFFKIITATIIEDGQLGIPKKFICKHGKYLPDAVVLKAPGGTVWQVGLKKVDGIIWFQNGWKEFIEHHSICVGQFLVFSYDGKYQFYVLIFDVSGNEIIYSRTGQLNHAQECYMPQKVVEDDNYLKNLDISPNKDDSIAKRSSSKKALATGKPVETQDKDGVIQTADTFQSKYPYFRISMTAAYMRSYLPIPSTFYQRYLPQGSDSFTLKVSNRGTNWHVGCYPVGKRMRICRGLSAFIEGSKIKIGDICFFELINRKDGVLRVKIFS